MPLLFKHPLEAQAETRFFGQVNLSHHKFEYSTVGGTHPGLLQHQGTESTSLEIGMQLRETFPLEISLKSEEIDFELDQALLHDYRLLDDGQLYRIGLTPGTYDGNLQLLSLNITHTFENTFAGFRPFAGLGLTKGTFKTPLSDYTDPDVDGYSLNFGVRYEISPSAYFKIGVNFHNQSVDARHMGQPTALTGLPEYIPESSLDYETIWIGFGLQTRPMLR
ncbi:MAG: hypothetical protein ACON4J_07235 [Parvibaculales bacterium]